MNPTNENAAHRPGAASVFFIYKAGLLAACFWGWLAALALLSDQVSPWHLIAAGGAICTTLVTALLAVLNASQRSAAARHEQMMRALAESVRTQSTVERDTIIRLTPEARQRPGRYASGPVVTER